MASNNEILYFVIGHYSFDALTLTKHKPIFVSNASIFQLAPMWILVLFNFTTHLCPKISVRVNKLC